MKLWLVILTFFATGCAAPTGYYFRVVTEGSGTVSGFPPSASGNVRFYPELTAVPATVPATQAAKP